MQRRSRSILARRLTIFASLLVAIAMHVPSRSLASTSRHPFFELRLLRADAVLFAQITELRVADDDPEAVDIYLGHPAVVDSRWNLDDEPLNRFRVMGRLTQAADGTSVAFLPDGYELKLGARYLFMLHGGEWMTAPLIRSPLEVSDDKLRCGSGEVYAITSFGFSCGTSGNMASLPISEAQAHSMLARTIRLARARRPQLETKRTLAAKPLSLSRIEGNP